MKKLYDTNRITFETGEPMLKYYKNEEKEICHVMKCNDRHDKKFIFFKEIEETKEEEQ